ncbi:MAG TPA: primosomal protein N' [Gemmatimonadales bacterium]|jgi:primosomal protein N' (replication factor Y)
MTERFAQVALPLPLPDPYTYRIPATLADRALPGARVVVPVRRQEWIGIVTAVDAPAPGMTARDILGAPDAQTALPPPLLELGRQISRYYGAPIGLVLRAMLPAALWGHSTIALRAVTTDSVLGGTVGRLLEWLHDRGGTGSAEAAARALKRPVWDVIDRLQRVGAIEVEVVAPDTGGALATVRVAALAGSPLSLLERERRFARAPKQRALYQALEDRGGRIPVDELLAAGGAGTGPLKSLQSAGLVTVTQMESPRDPFAGEVRAAPHLELTPDQVDALAALETLALGDSALLFGVTGSGKTQVYLERIKLALDAGRGAIVLVPEISLTPQTVGRIRAMFPDDVAVLHSGLSGGERADAWRALRRGDRRIAVGPRSAVFAPVRDLGVIVIDEEHESSYKNSETPRYHARTVALMRARLEGATVILGTATPSLESWTQAVARGRVVRLPHRVAVRPMPAVEIVDLRQEPQAAGATGLPWTRRIDDALQSTLAAGNQALLLLNRRGWASFVQCTACGTVVECPNCSISLTVHRHPDRLRCHYCDFQAPMPETCAVCGGVTTRSVGAGTQQLERLVADRFPGARVARMDLDTTSTKWSHHRILERVERGDVDVLLGTQMIAKGIDFPNVTMVGVVDADTSLHLPDFRAAERTFQLVAQVAGRAGRGPKGGRVLVQTRQPGHAAIVFASNHDAEGFLAAETELRRSPAYPPHTSLMHLVVSGEDQAAVGARAAALADWCERTIARNELPLLVLGPAPCPIERINDRWRVHLILKGPPQALGRWVRTAAPRLGVPRGGVRISIDRDPDSLM